MIQDISADFTLTFQLADSSDTPVSPDAAPTFRVYDGEDGLVGDGTATPFLTGDIDTVSNANPAVVTAASHKLRGVVRVTISGVVGPTAVNTTTTATVVDASTFTVPIDTSAASAYVSGGVWLAVGAYSIEFDSSIRSAMEPGRTYTVFIDYAVASARKVQTIYLEAA